MILSRPRPTPPADLLLRIWYLLTGLAGLEGLLIAVWMLSETSSGGGYSAARLGAALLAGASGLLFLGITFWRVRHPQPWLHDSAVMASSLHDRHLLRRAIAWRIALCLIFAQMALMAFNVQEIYSATIFQRLQPLMLYAALLAGQDALRVLLTRYGLNVHSALTGKRTLQYTLICFGVGLLAWAWVALSGNGLRPENLGWYAPGPPLVETQALLGITLALAVAALFVRLARIGWFSPRSDWLSVLFLWMASGLIWSITPSDPNWFQSLPREPNQLAYPNSDALTYANTGQHLLVGEGLKSLNRTGAYRPFYTGMVGILFGLSGLNSATAALVQSWLLALFPAVVYAIGAKLHNRLAGLLAAAFVTLRGYNALVLADVVTTSNVKTFMVEYPTALMAALFGLVAITWWQATPNRRPFWSLMLGATAAAGVMIRPEIGILLPVAGGLALLSQPRAWRTWAGQMVLAALGLGLVLTPWVGRNYLRYGIAFLDSPVFRAELVLQRYTPNPAVADNRMLPGESAQEFVERVAETTTGFVSENPQQVIGFISNHYWNSQIQWVLQLPVVFRLPDALIALSGHGDAGRFVSECCSAEQYARRVPIYLQPITGLTSEMLIPVCSNLLLLAAGIAVAGRQRKLMGIMPLGFTVAFLMLNAIFRTSGGRYLMPIDWTASLYYAIGISALIQALLIRNQRSIFQTLFVQPVQLPEADWSWHWNGRAIGHGALVALLLGAWLPVMEWSIPQMYPAERQAALIQSAGQALTDSQTDAIQRLLDQGGGGVWAGRAMYGRFYEPGEGEESNHGLFAAKPYRQISFMLIGPTNLGVNLPVANFPATLADGADVVVYGCPTSRSIDARLVVMLNENGQPAWLAANPNLGVDSSVSVCPPPAP